MGFVDHKEAPENGDTVIIYLNFNLFYALVLKSGETFQTKYGAIRHNDVIGRPYGSRITCTKGGYVHALWPTPELWTLSLPHRTQILYARDISLALFHLDIRPGSVVIESGTGSGSMTHSLARAVAPHGKVYTFDFHQIRSETAQKEFESHGIGDIVQCGHRDVCGSGFGLEGVADAVFLDLPHPWLAVEHAIAALKDEGGRICSFSPCIEQVQRTCDRLRELRCIDVVTLECLERPYEVKKVHLPKQNSGRKGTIEYFIKEESCENGKSENNNIETEKNGKDQGLGDTEMQCENADGSAGEPMEVKEKDPSEDKVDEASKEGGGESATKRSRGGVKKPGKGRYAHASDESATLTAIPTVKIPGHTGYLTFATFLGRTNKSAAADKSST